MNNRPAVRADIVAFAVLAIVLLASCERERPETRGRFWFDRVTFHLLPGHTERLGGPIAPAEMETIEAGALRELQLAYAEFRIAFSKDSGPIYRVRVVESDLGKFGGAGQSVSFGALGGQGVVSFPTLAAYAIHYAPPDADRKTMIDGIARAIGRAAAHEFAHQLVPRVNIHASDDPESYEYRSADRPAQCYGPIHWGLARPALLKTLGSASPAAP